MSYLLDTCILSKLRKIGKQADTKLENWIGKHAKHSYFLSALTIGEIRSGIDKLDIKKSEEREKRMILEDWLLEHLLPRFHNRILAIDLQVALTWGKIVGEKNNKE